MDTNSPSDDDIRQIATAIMDNLMAGSAERDWVKHTRDFTAEAKAGLTDEELQRQCESYQSRHGHFGGRRFLGVTRHPDYVNILWAQAMTRSTGEYMAVLTLVRRGREHRVIRCWVDLWEPTLGARDGAD